MLRALIFDFDGLILDTETPMIRAFAAVHAHHGIPYDAAHALSVVGHVDIDFEPWKAFPSHHDRAELEQLWHTFKRELLLQERILPGVESLLQDAKVEGLKLAIASNSPHAWVDRHLHRIGLFSYFDAVCCRDDVDVGKPDPEVYLRALRILGVTAQQAVSFEDSPPGSQAAHEAGIYSVVVPNPSTRHHAFPHAHEILQTLAERPLSHWQAVPERRKSK